MVRAWLNWLSLHAVVRGLAGVGARRGDLQGRLIRDPAVRADPGGFADQLRARGTLVRTRAAWLTADHALVGEVLRSDDFSVMTFGSGLPRPLQWLHDRTTVPGRLHPVRPPSLLSVNPPRHTRYRKTVSSVFTPRAVAALGDRVQATADELLDTIDGEGPGDPGDSVDIVDRYCARLPVAVIGDILGVPAADRDHILEFGELAAPSLDIGLSWRQFRSVERGLDGFDAWLGAHLARLRADPGDDLLSQLVTGGDLDDEELLSTAGLVLAAGFETTVNLLGNGIRLLLSHPHQLARLIDDPQLWPQAVEEILRFDSPVQLSGRIVTRSLTFAGRNLAAGDAVVLHLAGANRDPAVFADPHRFDVTRANAGRHQSFSGGRHFCLGAALARTEGAVGLRAFFDRFPDARLNGDAVRRDTRVLRGWASLPVHLRARTSRSDLDVVV